MNCGVVSPTLNDVNLTSFVIPCDITRGRGGGVIDLQCCKLCHLSRGFYIHGNISLQVADKRRYGFDLWMNSSIVHYNICSLVHKKCHMKCPHSDVKYYMTYNVIFCVLSAGYHLELCIAIRVY